jgi:site-specific DNA-methyltransferase (adenine-specific)
MADIRIIHGDCMEAMKEMEDKAYELAIVDPPYGVGDFKQSVGYDRRPYNKNWQIEWNDKTPTKDYFTELYRISTQRIIWGFNYYSPFIKDVGVLVWDKGNNSGIGSSCELASLSMRTRVDRFFYQWTGFCNSSKESKIHPCQKPVRLYEWLLKNYAKPGDKILDTHGGSCSLAIACDIMGFDCTIYEIDEDYYKAAVDRFNRHKQQLTLAL